MGKFKRTWNRNGTIVPLISVNKIDKIFYRFFCQWSGSSLFNMSFAIRDQTIQFHSVWQRYVCLTFLYAIPTFLIYSMETVIHWQCDVNRGIYLGTYICTFYVVHSVSSFNYAVIVKNMFIKAYSGNRIQ